MVSKEVYTKAKKVLIDPQTTDRAGAPAQASVNELATQLKETHQFNFAGTEIAWKIWANAIQAAEPHLRETMIQAPPPSKILNLFTRAATHPDTIIQDIRENSSIAVTIADTHLAAINRCRSAFDDLKVTRDILNLRIDTLNQRLQILEAEASAHRQLVGVFQAATGAEHTDASDILAARVTNQEDVDHI